MIRKLSSLALCLGAGALWIAGNIYYGNIKALEWLGWLKGYPWFIAWIVAVLPSASQLYITEEFSSDDGEELDALSMIFAVFVAIVLDLGGPTLGFYVVSGLPFNIVTLLPALVVAAFVSVLCQHVFYVRARALLGYPPRRRKQKTAKTHPVAEKIKGKQDRTAPHFSQYPNGRGERYDFETMERHD